MPALTAQSSWNIDTTDFPLGPTALGVYQSRIYAMDNQKIRVFNTDGTLDTAFNRNFSLPARASGIPTTHRWHGVSSITQYTISWYLLIQHQVYFFDRPGQSYWYSMHRYNNEWRYQGHLWNFNGGANEIRDIKIDSNQLYVLDDAGHLEVRSLADGTRTSTDYDVATNATALAILPTRFYVVEPTAIRAYDRSGSRVTADDTTLTGFYPQAANHGGGVISNTFYFVGSTSATPPETHTVFRYSGVNQASVAYSAYWGPVLYAATRRQILSVVFLPETPSSSVFDVTQDFEVQMRSGSAGSYSWATASGWTMSGSSSGRTRSITGTADNTVAMGTYRLVLKANAFGTGKPASAVASRDVEFPVGAPTPQSPTPTYDSNWLSPFVNPTTRAISCELRLSENPGSAFVVTDDVRVEKRSGSVGSYTWTEDTNWSLLRVASGAANNPDYSVWASPEPAQNVTAGTYRLVLKANAFGTGKPAADDPSQGVAVGAYVATPVQTAFAYWSSPSHNINTRELSAVLNMAEDPGAAFDASQDFEVQMFGASVWATSSGWTFASTGSGTTRTITATPTGSIQDGRYRMVLKEDAFGTDKPEAPLPSTAVMVQSTTTPTTPTTPTPREPARIGAELANQTEAGAFLMEVDLTTNQCRVIKRWAYITIAARSLEVHDGEVYWFEGSHYGNRRRRAVVGTTPDADGSIPVRYPETLGNVFSVKPGTRDITDHGINWRSQFDYPADDVVVPDYGFHTQTASPMRSDGENLYLISGFGGLQGITSIQYATSRRGPVGVDVVTDIGNWQLLKYSEDLDRRIWLFNGNGMKGWEAIRVLASLTQSFIGIDRHGLFYFTSKGGIHAEVQSSAPGSIEFRNPTDIFPQQGLIEINNEIIGYSGIIGRQFLNIARAQYGTSSASHATGSTIRLIKTVLNTSQSVFDPIDESDIRSNTSQLFNKIVVSYDNENEYEYQDDASIRRYGERIYEMTLPLNELQTAWIEDVARRFIDAHKDVHHLITLRMHEDFDIEVTDVVFLQIPERSQFNHACQVYQVTQNPTNRETELILRTL